MKAWAGFITKLYRHLLGTEFIFNYYIETHYLPPDYIAKFDKF